MRTCSFRRQIACATAVALLVCSVARADEPADFYQGKTITLYLGYPPSGAYDLYARAIARHMSRHMAGHPQFVVRHKPGAASAADLKFLRHLQQTRLGTSNRKAALES
jgi:tripartite-type tricarboxylate transporter receptor subunit TctC